MPKSLLAAAALALAAAAPPPAHPQAEAQALDLARQAIALRSVAGPGNQTPQVAALLRDALVAGGFAAKDVQVVPMAGTAYLLATWPGSDPSLKPVVILGHMDVVAANPADWQRDPFTPVVEGGYLFGRGATDMKLDATLAVAALGELRREGFRPKRTIVVAFSGDEETDMRTGAALGDRLKDAEMVLNVDGTGGVLDEATGRPLFFAWDAAEKTYADFRLTITNPGGHSSEPRQPNAIAELAAALLRINAYRFTPELNPITRAQLSAAAAYEDPKTAAAMRAFVADPADEAAIRTLSADPARVGTLGTTCVVTEVAGGHALNALPQRATANVNCRIFPGHSPAAIMAELSRVAADPAIRFEDVSEGSVPTAASPLRPDVAAAITHALAASYPGVPNFPSQSSGASDGMWFRRHGVPSYGISPLFIKDSENFSHGLNERTPVADIRPSVDYLLSLFGELAG